MILTRSTNFKFEVGGGGGPCNNQGVVQLSRKYLQVYFHHSSPIHHAPMQFGSSTVSSSTYFYLLEEARQRKIKLLSKGANI